MLTANPVACTEAAHKPVPQGVDKTRRPLLHPTPPQHRMVTITCWA